MAPLFLEQLDSLSLPSAQAARTPHATPETLAVHYTIALVIPYFRLQVWKGRRNLVLVPRADTDTCFRNSPGEKLSWDYMMMMGHRACKGQGSLENMHPVGI